MSVQIIEHDGKPEWAVIPYETYLQLMDQADLLQDIQDYDAAKAAIARGDEELIPSNIAYAILDGENPIKVWREYRQYSQQDLAKMGGISTPYLSQLEKGKRKGSLQVLSALAKALRITLDDITF